LKTSLPGSNVVVAAPVTKSRRREDDPVMEAFLSFLAADMAASPQQIKPLDRALAGRIDAMVGRLPAMNEGTPTVGFHQTSDSSPRSSCG
jgi:hypothetical protein